MNELKMRYDSLRLRPRHNPPPHTLKLTLSFVYTYTCMHSYIFLDDCYYDDEENVHMYK